ncbi:MAG: RNA polymerase sigma factor SigZ, partial [Clostridia bacterium]|nr:RNA polymerase sigma factor SigZ [Clostridia bacterium]
MADNIKHIWDEFSIPLNQFIKKRIPNEQDAEDISQEVFIKIYNHIERLKDGNKMRAWIYSIARNEIADYHRRSHIILRKQEYSDNMIAEMDEDMTFNREIAQCLKVMINRLPEKYKEAILLTEYRHITQKELSEKTGLSLSGAKSRVQRARCKLKASLQECCELEFDRRGNIINYKEKNK